MQNPHLARSSAQLARAPAVQLQASQRRHSASCASAVTAAKAGLLFECSGAEDAWDGGAVANPVVRVFPGQEGQRWFLWYTGRAQAAADTDAALPAAGSIGVATSDDGVHWHRGAGDVQGTRRADDVGACLRGDAENWWTLDTNAVALGDVQLFSSDVVQGGAAGVYWMFYTGVDFQPLAAPAGLPNMGVAAGAEMEGLCARPGLAMSQDGTNWARIEGEHHTHAVFDRGDEGDFDALFVAQPQVLAAGPNDMRLYYYTFDEKRQRFCIGLATSENGLRWQKQGCIFAGSEDADAFDSAGAAAHSIVRDLDTRNYYMFYEAVDKAGRRCVGVATSSDGLHDWQRHPEPVLHASGESNAWDSGGVGSPCAVSMAGGRWRLYYAGKREADSAWRGIGVALSPEDRVVSEAPTSFARRVE